MLALSLSLSLFFLLGLGVGSLPEGKVIFICQDFDRICNCHKVLAGRRVILPLLARAKFRSAKGKLFDFFVHFFWGDWAVAFVVDPCSRLHLVFVCGCMGLVLFYLEGVFSNKVNFMIN